METLSSLETPMPVVASSGVNAPDFEIYTRPEIRKGCLWDIQLRFNPEFVKKHQLNQIHVEKPRGASDTATYLCLKIRSKLIKPIRELPFTKVATTVTSEGDVLYFNDFSTVTLKVKFTARPRAVFHKHSDMMILLVSVKRGERVIASNEAELIFRGGTGSIHSAETRKATTGREVAPVQTPNPTTAPPPPPAYPFGLSSIPPATRTVAPRPSDVLNTPIVSANATSNEVQRRDDSPSHPVLEFEDFDSHQFCNDFIQNKGDALLTFSSGGFAQHTFDDLLNSDNDFSNGLWAEHLFNEFEAFQGTPTAVPPASATGGQSVPTQAMPIVAEPVPASSQPVIPTSETQSQQSEQVVALASTPQDCSHSHEDTDCAITSEYTVVFGKRRGSCITCGSDCSYYKGSGGPCNECGCYPTAHFNLDAPQTNPRKRRRVSEAYLDESEFEGPNSKRPKYLLEVKYYQKLFVSCLQYMTLPQISAVCSRAPVPIWVKDSSFTYIYINSTFLTFIMDVTQNQHGVLNQNVAQVFDQVDADNVIKQEKYLMEQGEGTIKTFDVPIRREVYRVMKQWTKLPDGKKVIIGVVVSNP